MLNRSGIQNAYSYNVRIGNWNEEKELQELRMKEYLHRKEKGQLLVHTVQQHLNTSLQEVPLSYSQDGFIHIGDEIMMYSVQTEGVLSVDCSDKLTSSDQGFAVTSSTLTQAHVARNVFVIEGYGNNVQKGDILKLGQPFRMRINPALMSEGFYLQSQPMSASCCSKVTRNQEVGVVKINSYDNVWVCQFKDYSKRFEMEGQPVPANAEILVVHAGTKNALSSDKIPYHNDFGQEFEVCCKTSFSIGKKQGLYAELQGKTTSDVPLRKEGSVNWWAFLTAATPNDAGGSANTEQKQPMGGGNPNQEYKF